MIRDIMIATRFKSEELVHINKKMKELNFKSRSKYMRFACLNGFVITKTTTIIEQSINSLKQQVFDLNSIGVELNQLARILNSGDDINVKNILYSKKVLHDICNRNFVELKPTKNRKRSFKGIKTNQNCGSSSNSKFIIKFRVSKEELTTIHDKMHEIGINSQSLYIRLMCINNFIVEINNSQEQELFKLFSNVEYELNSIKVNVKQIASKLKFNEEIQIDDIYAVLNDLDKISQNNLNLIDNTIENYYQLFERTGANGLYKH